jgi:hypothetical protein
MARITQRRQCFLTFSVYINHLVICDGANQIDEVPTAALDPHRGAGLRLFLASASIGPAVLGFISVCP